MEFNRYLLASYMQKKQELQELLFIMDVMKKTIIDSIEPNHIKYIGDYEIYVKEEEIGEEQFIQISENIYRKEIVNKKKVDLIIEPVNKAYSE